MTRQKPSVWFRELSAAERFESEAVLQHRASPTGEQRQSESRAANDHGLWTPTVPVPLPAAPR